MTNDLLRGMLGGCKLKGNHVKVKGIKERIVDIVRPTTITDFGIVDSFVTAKATVDINSEKIALFKTCFIGDVHKVNSRGVGLAQSVVVGDIETLNAGTGLAFSGVFGDVRSVRSSGNALDCSIVWGNINTVDTDESVFVNDSTAYGVVGDVISRYIFNGSVFNMIVGNKVMGAINEGNYHFPNLIVTPDSEGIRVVLSKGLTNFILPEGGKMPKDVLNGLIIYRGDFKELMDLAKEHPDLFTSFRCIPIKGQVSISSLEDLMNLGNLACRGRIQNHGVEFIDYIRRAGNCYIKTDGALVRTAQCIDEDSLLRALSQYSGPIVTCMTGNKKLSQEEPVMAGKKVTDRLETLLGSDGIAYPKLEPYYMKGRV